MKKPIPVRRNSPPDYPALDEFRCKRREFLSRIGAGCLAAGLGVTALLHSPYAAAEDPTAPQPPGGMRIADYDTIHLPNASLRSIYLANNEYLRYQLVLHSHAKAITDFCTAHEAALLERVEAHLQTKTCDAILKVPLAQLESELFDVFNAFSVSETGEQLNPDKLSVGFVYESCELQERLPPGEAPAQHFP